MQSPRLINRLPRAAEPLWSIDKNGFRVDCALIDRGMQGVDVEISSFGNWSSAHRCESRGAAISEAEELKAGLLRKGGRLI